MKNGKSLNPWPICIIAFFAVAIIGCATFIVFCSRHPADLVAADYYEQEVRYQGQMDRIQHVEQGAQPATVIYNAATRRIIVSLPPQQSPSRTSGKIQLYRPSASDLDRVVKLQPNQFGVQTIDASTLVPGLWKVRVSWEVDAREYFVDQKLVIAATSS
jgi:hypothetical protein